MTSSETPTDDDLPRARAREPEQSPADPDRRIRQAVIGGAILAGWGFILWAHNMRVTAPVVFMWLGWLAVVAGVHYLWRTGTATSDVSDEEATWWRPIGERDELEREKRALLKAIKEVEFDHETGKMSEKDAQAIIRGYRARAIEVIKVIDELDAGGGERSIRDQIDRELRARVEIASQIKKPEVAADTRKAGKPGKAAAKRAGAPAKAEAKPAAAAAPAEATPTEATPAEAEADTEPEPAAAADTAPAKAAQSEAS